MDILRKELNEIYASQDLDKEYLNASVVDAANAEAAVLSRVGGGSTVITDASSDHCYVFCGKLGRLMGFSAESDSEFEFESSDEDIIYNRLHPQDLADKRLLEYEFFKLVSELPSRHKMSYVATARLRMKDASGNYRYICNSTRISRLSPAGKIWLILCCYELSTGVVDVSGIAPCIINIATGSIDEIPVGQKRGRILSKREKEILRLIQTGLASKQIADSLGISVHTVNRHRQNIISKLCVGNSIEAITAAKAMNLF